MKAMLLAAGRGARMGELTLNSPKPLLRAGGRTLIERQIERLVAAGIADLVINLGWQGDQIEDFLNDGKRLGANIRYSREDPTLETAGGIANAMGLLQNDPTDSAPFAVISTDIYSEFDYKRLHSIQSYLANSGLNGYCVMVPNPAHHLGGDFACINGLLSNGLLSNGLLSNGLLNSAQGAQNLTYSGIGVFCPTMFESIVPGQFEKLATLLNRDVPQHLIGAEIFEGRWNNIDTPERLAQINSYLAKKVS